MMIKMIFVESMMEMIFVASPLRWEDGGTTHGKTIQSGMMQVVLKGTAIIFNIIIIIAIMFFFLFSLTIFWPKKDKVGSEVGALEKNFNFCLKWSKWAQMVPKGSQMVKDNFGRFWTLLNHFGTFTSLSCFAVFGPNWTIFGTSPVMKGGPQSKKTFFIRSLMN